MRARPLSRWQKILAVPVIAIAAVSIAMILASIPPTRSAANAIDRSFYDALFRLRAPESQLDSDIVIIAVDQNSIDRIAKEADAFRWPWPREYWGHVLQYVQKCGAKAVAIDLLFEEPSGYNRELNDDAKFAETLDDLKMPVIHAVRAVGATTLPAFAPPVKRPQRFGAVDVIDDAVVRRYYPVRGTIPSLAVQTAMAADGSIAPWASDPFLLHYYGPSRNADGTNTFRYVPAADVIAAIRTEGSPSEREFSAAFKNRIVLIGATAAAAFDLKSAPVASIYPSVEAQATAIQNLLKNQRVIPATLMQQVGIALFGALLAGCGSVMPRRVRWKLPVALSGAVLVLLIGYFLFTAGPGIIWLPLSAPLLAALLAMVTGLSWTYLVEDRQRRVLLQFLSQYVSPDVAAALQRSGEISLGGQRREMTVMFTDIAGFTGYADKMPVEQLEKFMNLYLSEMSSVLFEFNATLDKYIGDAIMSFWNAPLGQPKHAELACRAALAMKQRETQSQAKFADFGVENLCTRIGINTGSMVVGNVGSEQKVNFTVLGDAVNLASRLEGSNKIYGSSILVAESTVQNLEPGEFLFRRLDRLRVRGRSGGTEVYELLCAAPFDSNLQTLARQFDLALSSYFEQHWGAAEQILIELSARFPHDGPTRVLLERTRAFRSDPPGAGWDGVHDAGH